MKKIIKYLALLSCITLSGCFPTGEIEKTDTQNSFIDSELNISPREGLVYNLSIPDEYLETYSPLKCRKQLVDSSMAEELFPNCTVDTVEVLDRPEEENYKLFQKEDSWVCFQDGKIYKWKQGEIEYNYLKNAFDMPKPYWMIREEFPQTDIDSLPVFDYVVEMNRIVNKIGVEVGEPRVYVVTEKLGDEISKKYFKDTCNRKITREDCCVIQYSMILNGLPIADYSYVFQSSSQEWFPNGCSIFGLFNKDGQLIFECRGILDIVETEEPQQLCTPEYAIEQMKEYFERTTLKGNLYGCEQCVLVYWKNEKYTGDFYARPVWAFGWQEEEGKKLQPYYVDAITGHVL